MNFRHAKRGMSEWNHSLALGTALSACVHFLRAKNTLFYATPTITPLHTFNEEGFLGL